MVVGSPDTEPPGKTRLFRGGSLFPKNHTIPEKDSDWLFESDDHSESTTVMTGRVKWSLRLSASESQGWRVKPT